MTCRSQLGDVVTGTEGERSFRIGARHQDRDAYGTDEGPQFRCHQNYSLRFGGVDHRRGDYMRQLLHQQRSQGRAELLRLRKVVLSDITQ